MYTIQKIVRIIKDISLNCWNRERTFTLRWFILCQRDTHNISFMKTELELELHEYGAILLWSLFCSYSFIVMEPVTPVETFNNPWISIVNLDISAIFHRDFFLIEFFRDALRRDVPRYPELILAEIFSRGTRLGCSRVYGRGAPILRRGKRDRDKQMHRVSPVWHPSVVGTEKHAKRAMRPGAEDG